MDSKNLATAHLEGGGRRRSSVAPVERINQSVIAMPDETLRRMSVANPYLNDTISEAREQTEIEHNMGVWKAVRLYPKAVAFSMLMSLCLIMEGYDTALIGNFYGLLQFRKKFGEPTGTGDYQISWKWQAGLQNGAQIGQISGLMLAGWLADHIGYKKTILAAQFLMIGFIFLFFFAQNIGMLFAAGILSGIPWGAFQTLTTTYAADVCPIPLRPILTTFVNMCWVIGQLLTTGILRGLLTRQDDWAWRIPYAIQWVWPIPIIIGIWFAPESPTWLVKKGRDDEARVSLRQLTSKKISEAEIDRMLTTLQHTNEYEKTISAGTSYLDCFRGTNRRRTEIACIVWTAQVFCGIWFGGNVVYFLEQAGFDQVKAFDFGIGTGGLALAGTMTAWWIMTHVGRRRLYVVGLAIMFCILLIVGFMGIPNPSPAIGYASGGFMMLFTLTFDLTVGPVAYCLVAEIPSTRLRIKTVVLARNTYNVASIIANFLNPPILNPTAWNLRGKGGFVWCGFCLAELVYMWFRLPEPKGLSPGELDVLFERGVPARQFKKTEVDAFRSDTLVLIPDNDGSDEHIDRAAEKV